MKLSIDKHFFVCNFSCNQGAWFFYVLIPHNESFSARFPIRKHNREGVIQHFTPSAIWSGGWVEIII
jgi:hypothetical protein